MGHLVGKDLYRALGDKLDSLAMRAPWNEAFHEILQALYTEEEAAFIVKLPWRLATLSRIQRLTGEDAASARRILGGLCEKGLVIDVVLGRKTRYMLSPYVIGVFEFTMMRTGQGTDPAAWARMLHAYMADDATFWAANFGDGQGFGPLRALPHEEALSAQASTEILDYERARALAEAPGAWAVGTCSCRHTMHHLGSKRCDTPLESCLSNGVAADYLIRNKLARPLSQAELLEQLAASRERGLVFCADNVQQDVAFLCQCCGCCCHALMGIKKFGYPNVVLSSSYLPRVDAAACSGCGKCKAACPVDAIALRRLEPPQGKKRFEPEVDEALCLGCGVCALRCETQSLKLEPRARRVITPETSFHRVILAALQNGTLQNLLFDEPARVTHQFMRGFVGGFLRLDPVKRALAGDLLRSRFLGALASRAAPAERGLAARN